MNEGGRERILEALPSQAGGEGPAPLTREIVALLFREVYGTRPGDFPARSFWLGGRIASSYSDAAIPAATRAQRRVHAV
jgi:hypothetical protein